MNKPTRSKVNAPEIIMGGAFTFVFIAMSFVVSSCAGNFDHAVRPQPLPAVMAVAAGGGHSLFITSDGALWVMGANGHGQLGDGTHGPNAYRLTPERIVTSGVIAVSAGPAFSLFLKNDGSLWGMGDNNLGWLGDDTTAHRYSPVCIVPSGVTAISAGDGLSLFLKNDGSLWGMGGNNEGGLGDGTRSNRLAPVRIVASDVTAISAGNGYSLFIKNDGSLWGMGRNLSGELGDGTTKNRFAPVRIVASGVTAIHAGVFNTLFVKSDGSLWGMGWNDDGQLGDGQIGDGSTTGALAPNQIDTLVPKQIVASGVLAVSTGVMHSLFLKNDGSLWGMGWNGNGELGDGTTTHRFSPECIVPNGVVAMAAGGGLAMANSLFIKSDGSLWGMGFNNGALGDGTLFESPKPVQITITTTSPAGSPNQ